MASTADRSAIEGGARALVIGASGGIGGALVAALRADGRFASVNGWSRHGTPAVDITDEAGIRAAAAAFDDSGLRLVIDATGLLHAADMQPEKSLAALDPEHLARAFAVNAVGPMLLMKHLLPRFPRGGRSVFATLSARVGSITDNRLGGWYGYRASKAALNQAVRTAAVELARRSPGAICVALHPGTVDTALSAPFARRGLEVAAPARAAARLLAVLDGLGPTDSGGFFDQHGKAIPW